MYCLSLVCRITPSPNPFRQVILNIVRFLLIVTDVYKPDFGDFSCPLLIPIKLFFLLSVVLSLFCLPFQPLSSLYLILMVYLKSSRGHLSYAIHTVQLP